MGGTYMALASTPLIVGSLLAGNMSGWLLETFCPEHGPRHSELMWFIVGCISLSSPLLLYALRHFVNHPADSVAKPHYKDQASSTSGLAMQRIGMKWGETRNEEADALVLEGVAA